MTHYVHLSTKMPDIKIPLNKSHKDKLPMHSINCSFKMQSLPSDLFHFMCFIALLTSLKDKGMSSSENAELSNLKSLFTHKSSTSELQKSGTLS